MCSSAALAQPPPPAPAPPAPAPAAAPAEPPPEEHVAAEEERPIDAPPVDVRSLLRWEIGPLWVAPLVLVSAQAVPYVGEDAFFQSGDIAEQGGFRLRHARVGLHAGYEDLAELRVSTELAGAAEDQGSVTIHDAYVGVMPWEFLQFHGGAQTVPLSRYALVSSGKGAFIERPLATRAMTPGHQVGGVVSGLMFNGALGYGLGLFNGLQRSNQFYEGYIENYAPFGNRFDGLAYVVRVTSEPFGRLPGTVADEDQGPVQFGAGGNYMYSDGGARDVHTAGGDALVHWMGIHGMVEALWARTVPETEPSVAGAVPVEVTTFSFVAEAGYMIFPRRFGVAARFEWIEPNDKQDDESDNWLLGGAATVHLFDQLVKAQLEYTHREERNGVSLANDSVAISLQAQLDPARERRLGTREGPL